MNKIKLNDHIIGRGYSPFIIAEAGLNHNGEIEKAFEMIKVAKESGADAIKFQTFKASEFIQDTSLIHVYFSQGKKVTEPQFKLFERCEFTREEWFKIKEKCDKEKIMFLSTPENRTDLDLLLEIGISAIKVGSDELVNLPILKDYASTGLPIILSSGMANLSEVHDALKTVGALDGYPTILLVTTSQYPTPIEDVNLRKFETLSKTFPNIPLGFSDHTQGFLASSLACVVGAVCFEKHFTLSHNLPGPDHWFSADPNELIQWIKSIRTSHIMMGSEEIKPTKSEEMLKLTARRSIFAISDIREGDEFSMKNIGLRRPGNGLPPEYFETVLGKKSTKYFKKGEPIEL